MHASIAPTAPATTAGAPWLGYHSNDSRTGAVTADSGFDRLAKAWSTTLGGALHGQPVAADGRVVVADESNHVSALDPRTGKVLWSDYLGAPLTEVVQKAGCGDIDPLGITSTPVIDLATKTVYAVGEIASGTGAVHHQLEGIDILTGRVVRTASVDPPLPAGESAIHLLQRASLALGSGRVYVSYGGNDGDCGNYHGWVVGVNEAGPTDELSFEVATDGEGGAIWQAGGAPAIDASGDLFVTTGNANPDPPQGGPDPKKYTESVVKLSPTLQPLASFKDEIAGGDEDLSTGNPVLLPNGNLFAVGKTDVGYVLRQSDLSLVAKIPGICGSDPDGGPAYDVATGTMFVPCRGGGIQQVDLGTAAGAGGTAPQVGPRLQEANSSPILVGQRLWALQYPDGTLSEFNARTDARLQSVSIGTTVPIFSSPVAALGLMLVGSDTGVTAFEAAH
jgi:polyvinyl alcohol dehydrogenase (cytochrome)